MTDDTRAPAVLDPAPAEIAVALRIDGGDEFDRPMVGVGTFTRSDLEKLLADMDQVTALKRQRSTFASMDIYDYRVAYGSTELTDGNDLEDLGIYLDDEVWVVLEDPTLLELMRPDFRTDADRRVTYDNSVCWVASSKNGDGEFETASLTCQDVQELLARFDSPPADPPAGDR